MIIIYVCWWIIKLCVYVFGFGVVLATIIEYIEGAIRNRRFWPV